jgi:hypothetical protein
MRRSAFRDKAWQNLAPIEQLLTAFVQQKATEAAIVSFPGGDRFSVDRETEVTCAQLQIVFCSRSFLTVPGEDGDP